eukprot:2416636-Rhodomonas_salina.1
MIVVVVMVGCADRRGAEERPSERLRRQSERRGGGEGQPEAGGCCTRGLRVIVRCSSAPLPAPRPAPLSPLPPASRTAQHSTAQHSTARLEQLTHSFPNCFETGGKEEEEGRHANGRGEG